MRNKYRRLDVCLKTLCAFSQHPLVKKKKKVNYYPQFIDFSSVSVITTWFTESAKSTTFDVFTIKD